MAFDFLQKQTKQADFAVQLDLEWNWNLPIPLQGDRQLKVRPHLPTPSPQGSRCKF